MRRMICINITSLLIELVKSDFEKLCIKLYRKNPFCQEEEALEIFYDLFVDIVEDFLRFFTIEDQSDLLQFSKFRSEYKGILINRKGFLNIQSRKTFVQKYTSIRQIF